MSGEAAADRDNDAGGHCGKKRRDDEEWNVPRRVRNIPSERGIRVCVYELYDIAAVGQFT